MRSHVVGPIAVGGLLALRTPVLGHAQASGVLQATVHVVDTRASQRGLDRLRALVSGSPPSGDAMPGAAPLVVRVERPPRQSSGELDPRRRVVRVLLVYY